MTAKQIQNQITNLATDLLENDIAIDYNPALIKTIGLLDQISWTSNGKTNLIHSVPYATMSDYRRIVENRQYNLMLFDGSILQIFIELKRNDLNRQSMSYYPCPIRLPSDSIETGLPITELFDMHVLSALESLEWTNISYPLNTESNPDNNQSEYPTLTMRTPFRFDYDINSQNPGHPASHLHMCDQECRIPVFAPLSIGHFIRFIFINFYNELWDQHTFLQNVPTVLNNRSIKAQEEKSLYIDCRGN